MAASSAPRPVNGWLGPVTNAAFVGVLEAVEVEPPPVAVGLVSGLALPVMQVFTPLITPRSCAVLNRLQMVVFDEVVWTLDPPRTSVREGMVTLNAQVRTRPLQENGHEGLKLTWKRCLRSPERRRWFATWGVH